MSQNDQHDPEGHEPTEEVGPSGCEIGPDRAEIKPGELEGKPQESQVTLQDELSEAFVAEPLQMVISPVDGLPIPGDESSTLAEAPPFSIDTVVCIEDERTFVELFGDEVIVPAESPNSFIVVDRTRYTPKGEERPRMTFAPDRVVTRWGRKFVELSGPEWQAVHDEMLEDMPAGKTMAVFDSTPFMGVRPARERCAFYKRQVFSNDDQPDPRSLGHHIVFRNCTARRSVGGAFMSLRDEAMHACDYRDPPEPKSVEKHLDAKDRERLDRVVTRVPLFNIPAADPNYVPPAGNPMAPLYAGVERVTAEPAYPPTPSPLGDPDRAGRIGPAATLQPATGALPPPQGPVEAPITDQPILYVGVEPVTRGPAYPPVPFPVSEPGGYWSARQGDDDAPTAAVGGIMASAPLPMTPHEHAHQEFMAKERAREADERTHAERACLPFPAAMPPVPRTTELGEDAFTGSLEDAERALEAAEAAAEIETSAKIAAALEDDSDTPKTPRNS